MNYLNATFEDYQAQYETILPLNMRKGLTYLQVKVHDIVSVVDGALQIPDVTLRTAQLAVAVLSFIPALDSALEIPKQICKDAKNFMGVAKGLKSVDGFLNFQWMWRPIVINVSGTTLMIVSALGLIERLGVNIQAVKVSLKAIPIFGVLPYGGLFPLSVTGLIGVSTLFGLEKSSALIQEEERIKNEKFVYWSQPLDLNKVQQRQALYKARIVDLQAEVAAYDKLIEDGELLKDQFDKQPDQAYRIYTCQKALKELSAIRAKKQSELSKSQNKASQWLALEQNWTIIDAEELEAFRQAKYEKWQIKLNKLHREKRANLITITNNVIILARQVLVIIGVSTGYGIIALPMVVNIGLDAIVAGGGLATFLMRRSIKKIKISSVGLKNYVELHQP